MHIHLIAIGTNMPHWVSDAYDEYVKRLPSDFTLILKEIKLVPRPKKYNVDTVLSQEAEQILSANPSNSRLIALDMRGKILNNVQLADRFKELYSDQQNISLVIGGPDGLSEKVTKNADEVWSLSALTLPHTLVRVIVAEQIYRTWCILNYHPYHKNVKEFHE